MKILELLSRLAKKKLYKHSFVLVVSSVLPTLAKHFVLS